MGQDVCYDLSDDWIYKPTYTQKENTSLVNRLCEVKRIGEYYTRNAGEKDLLSREGSHHLFTMHGYAIVL